MTSDATTDTPDLLRRWHEGDEAALSRLLERELPWIRQLVHRRLGPLLRRSGETQDFVQEAMVEVLRYGGVRAGSGDRSTEPGHEL